jgi:S-adenosylmethionine:tRNA ribosyltransferase-isomerase
MEARDFAFDLPVELIAQEPLRDRGESRLLVLDRATGGITHSRFAQLPDWLRTGDLLVVNNTRVFPARLIGRRIPSGGSVECLLVGRRVEDDRLKVGRATKGAQVADGEIWDALMHPGQKLHPGARVEFPGTPALQAEVLEERFFGRRVIRLWTDDDSPVSEAVEAIGHVPLPPYIKRPDRADDRERYQTVFARARGSVAAPTAGLHFTTALLDSLDRRGVGRAEITLHVGYGTFQPVRVEQVEEHRVEPEAYEIGEAAADAITRARAEYHRIVSVGTTTTRAIEAVAKTHCGRVVATRGVTDLFIYPGFVFEVAGALLTNFHLPRSSLLMLVAAFAGRERVLNAYREAIAKGYRFYSYGDAMLIL